MTPEQMQKVIRMYDERVTEILDTVTTMGDPDLMHLSTMFPRMEKFLKEASEGGEKAQSKWDKLNRWLGFVQGVLFMKRVYTIDEMREHNRSKYSYSLPVDFSDIAQFTVFRCEGVQEALQRVADKFGCTTVKAEDGVILSLESEKELTDEQLAEMSQTIQDGWKAYLATK